MSINDLKAERAELQSKLDWMNVQSDAREKYAIRVREIDRTLSRAARYVEKDDRLIVSDTRVYRLESAFTGLTTTCDGGMKG